MDRITVESRAIIVGLVGSHGYGLSRPESDRDYRGVFIAPKNHYLGLSVIEQKDRGWDEPGVLPFLDGNTDTVIYELRKYMQLLAGSNPNILELLWLPEYPFLTPVGEKLIQQRHIFLSKKVKYTFSGYAFAQIKKIESHRKWLLNPPTKKPVPTDFDFDLEEPLTKDEVNAFLEYLYSLVRGKIEYLAESRELHQLLTGDIDFKGLLKQYPLTAASIPYSQTLTNSRGDFIRLLQRSQKYRAAGVEWSAYQSWQKNRNPQRAGMEQKSGYDLKHAMHCIRLLRCGREILRDGQVWVDRRIAGDAEQLRSIINGDYTYEQVTQLADQILAEMEIAYDQSSLPEQPDLQSIDQLCVELVEEFGW
jgi:uncharacterized protein